MPTGTLIEGCPAAPLSIRGQKENPYIQLSGYKAMQHFYKKKMGSSVRLGAMLLVYWSVCCKIKVVTANLTFSA